MTVFNHADKKWLVVLADKASRPWLRTQKNILNVRWVTVSGGDADFIKKSVASGMLYKFHDSC